MDSNVQLTVQPIDATGNEIALDLSQVYQAEARVIEVQGVTPAKAPELLATFNRAYLDLSKAIRLLELEYLKAQRVAKKRKAIILLDEAQQILKDRGLATARSPGGSADLREALLDSDDEYQQLVERVETIKVYRELLSDKRKGIEMAYHSVKRIISKEGGHRNVHLGGTMDGRVEPGMVQQPKEPEPQQPEQKSGSWGYPTY